MAKTYFESKNLKIFFESTKIKNCYFESTKVYSSGNIVTYIVDTGVSYSVEVEEGASCLSPTTFTPTKSGWTFTGWREDTTANASVLTSKVMGESPITLYAVFQQDVTVTYYDNSTTAKYSTKQKYYNNGNAVYPSFTFAQSTKDGWSARGWSYDGAANATMRWNNGGTAEVAENLTLCGCYQQYRCVYYYNNSSTKQTTDGYAYYNSYGNSTEPTFNLTVATVSEWSIRGWSTGSGASATVNYTSGSSYTITSERNGMTLYASWSKTVSASAVSYGSIQTMSGTAYRDYKGSTVDATTTTPSGATYSGWSWRGWSAAGTTGASADVTYANDASINLGTSGGFTIYGLYYQTVTLSYAGNGATSGSTASQTATRYWNAYGSTHNPTLTLAANGFTRTDYTFTGWDLGAVGASVTMDGNKTATAQWKAMYVAITPNNTSSSGNTSWVESTNKMYAIASSIDTATYSGIQVTFSKAEAHADFLYKYCRIILRGGNATALVVEDYCPTDSETIWTSKSNVTITLNFSQTSGTTTVYCGCSSTDPYGSYGTIDFNYTISSARLITR